MSNTTSPDNNSNNHYSMQSNSFINNQGPVQVGLFFEDHLAFSTNSTSEGDCSSCTYSPSLEQDSQSYEQEHENAIRQEAEENLPIIAQKETNCKSSENTSLGQQIDIEVGTKASSTSTVKAKSQPIVNPYKQDLSKETTCYIPTKHGQDRIRPSLRKRFVNPMLKKATHDHNPQQDKNNTPIANNTQGKQTTSTNAVTATNPPRTVPRKVSSPNTSNNALLGISNDTPTLANRVSNNTATLLFEAQPSHKNNTPIESTTGGNQASNTNAFIAANPTRTVLHSVSSPNNENNKSQGLNRNAPIFTSRISNNNATLLNETLQGHAITPNQPENAVAEHTTDILRLTNLQTQFLKPIRNPYNTKQNANCMGFNDTMNCNMITVKNLQSRKIYISPFLEKSQLPSEASIELEPELEPLRKLISSQHEAFTQHIKDLGEANLAISKVIEKKTDSYTLLTEHKKTPRSLRIKCTLSTTPEFETDDEFILLKKELDDSVADFIDTGTNIMTKWALRNITLLKLERCKRLFKKALQILDGLAHFHKEVIGFPTWPSVSVKDTTLFLIKIYLSNEFLDINNLIQYLELPLDQVRAICAQILTNKTSEDNALNFFNTLPLAEINMQNDLQHDFIFESLMQFDQIIKITTIDIWNHYKHKTKQINAGDNLKAKMAALETTDATIATVQAIARATNKFEETQHQNLHTQLRLSNVEKSLSRHEQKTNEIYNTLYKKNNNNAHYKQKNYKGSHQMEPMASPPKVAPNKRQKRQLVDLTTDEEEHATEQSPVPSPLVKHIKRHHGSNPRSIQWKTGEIHHYNPTHPAISPNPITTTAPFTSLKEMSILGQPPFFQPAPPPTPTIAPSPKPQFNPFTPHNHTLQLFGPNNMINPFQPHPNPFVTNQYIHTKQTPRRFTNKRSVRHQEGSRKGERKGN